MTTFVLLLLSLHPAAEVKTTWPTPGVWVTVQTGSFDIRRHVVCAYRQGYYASYVFGVRRDGCPPCCYDFSICLAWREVWWDGRVNTQYGPVSKRWYICVPDLTVQRGWWGVWADAGRPAWYWTTSYWHLSEPRWTPAERGIPKER